VKRRDYLAPGPGSFGWDGGYGTSGYSDPAEEMVGILMTQRVLDPAAMGLHTDFRTSAYQSVDD
jgi:CubicO group peptidase (beta-lactamase class C family)